MVIPHPYHPTPKLHPELHVEQNHEAIIPHVLNVCAASRKLGVIGMILG